MNRNARADIAKQTVAICDAGFYHAPNGPCLSIGDALAAAKTGTVLYTPEQLPPRMAMKR
jgi:hypothetical protein